MFNNTAESLIGININDALGRNLEDVFKNKASRREQRLVERERNIRL